MKLFTISSLILLLAAVPCLGQNSLISSCAATANNSVCMNWRDPSRAEVFRTLIIQSEAIWVGEFVRFKKRNKSASEKDPPVAMFKIVEVLRDSSEHPRFVPVRYQFFEPTASEKAIGPESSKALMPKKGSKWLLFLSHPVLVDNCYETSGGAEGRVPFSELDRVKDVLKNLKNGTRKPKNEIELL